MGKTRLEAENPRWRPWRPFWKQGGDNSCSNSVNNHDIIDWFADYPHNHYRSTRRRRKIEIFFLIFFSFFFSMLEKCRLCGKKYIRLGKHFNTCQKKRRYKEQRRTRTLDIFFPNAGNRKSTLCDREPPPVRRVPVQRPPPVQPVQRPAQRVPVQRPPVQRVSAPVPVVQRVQRPARVNLCQKVDDTDTASPRRSPRSPCEHREIQCNQCGEVFISTPTKPKWWWLFVKTQFMLLLLFCFFLPITISMVLTFITCQSLFFFIC